MKLVVGQIPKELTQYSDHELLERLKPHLAEGHPVRALAGTSFFSRIRALDRPKPRPYLVAATVGTHCAVSAAKPCYSGASRT